MQLRLAPPIADASEHLVKRDRSHARSFWLAAMILGLVGALVGLRMRRLRPKPRS